MPLTPGHLWPKPLSEYLTSSPKDSSTHPKSSNLHRKPKPQTLVALVQKNAVPETDMASLLEAAWRSLAKRKAIMLMPGLGVKGAGS